MLKRGKPFQPGNKFGRGRPQGSRNKSTFRAKEILDQHAEALLRKAVLLALQGDTAMLRTLVDRLLPRRRELPVKAGLLPMGTAEELSQASARVAEMLTKGQLTVGDAQGLTEFMEGRRRFIQTHDLEIRLRNLEQNRLTHEP